MAFIQFNQMVRRYTAADPWLTNGIHSDKTRSISGKIHYINSLQ